MAPTYLTLAIVLANVIWRTLTSKFSEPDNPTILKLIVPVVAHFPVSTSCISDNIKLSTREKKHPSQSVDVMFVVLSCHIHGPPKKAHFEKVHDKSCRRSSKTTTTTKTTTKTKTTPCFEFTLTVIVIVVIVMVVVVIVIGVVMVVVVTSTSSSVVGAVVVVVHINLGAGESEMASARGLTLNDLSWHEVNLTRREANITLQIDVIHTTRSLLPGRFFELNIHYGVFIGGRGDFNELFLETYSIISRNNVQYIVVNDSTDIIVELIIKIPKTIERYQIPIIKSYYLIPIKY
ncbi:chondroitin sulfate proteoglycan 4 isoform X2 [Vespula squamosa]|uniref:Chondroitin sulfate proteoglycan 4 isoform X2 n=1 Tax=Vespula squamosa TaxID=30214 RepID=A0ABD2ATY3_VESSQ